MGERERRRKGEGGGKVVAVVVVEEGGRRRKRARETGFRSRFVRYPPCSVIRTGSVFGIVCPRMLRSK